jgi:hypothetical protein
MANDLTETTFKNVVIGTDFEYNGSRYRKMSSRNKDPRSHNAHAWIIRNDRGPSPSPDFDIQNDTPVMAPYKNTKQGFGK